LGECTDLPNTSGPHDLLECRCHSGSIKIEDTICFDISSQDHVNQIFAYCSDVCGGGSLGFGAGNANPACNSG